MNAIGSARIAFRPLQPDDLPLLHCWLNTPHVVRWWREPLTLEEVAAKYLPRVLLDEAVQPFVIVYDGRPIGYIQTYRIRDHPDYCRAVDEDEEEAGVDLFIGEATHLHRRLGAPILVKFLAEIVFAPPGVESCIIGPEPANTVAIRAYEKAGFRYLKTIQVPGEPTPEYLMRITRAELNGRAR